MPECSGTPVFLVDTLMAYSGGILGPAGRILNKKGYILVGAREIKMPHNFLVRKENPSDISEKIEKGLRSADLFVSDLIEGDASWIDIPVFSDLLSLVSRSKLIWKALRKIMPMRTDDNLCTRCRLCERLCPVDNWSLNEDRNKMEWGSSCLYCMRCFSFCPVNAITYGAKKNIQYAAVRASDLTGSKV